MVLSALDIPEATKNAVVELENTELLNRLAAMLLSAYRDGRLLEATKSITVTSETVPWELRPSVGTWLVPLMTSDVAGHHAR